MGRHAAPAPERRPRKEVRRSEAAPVRRSTFTSVESATSQRHVRRAAYAALSAPVAAVPAAFSASSAANAALDRRTAKAAQIASRAAAAEKAHRMRTIKRLSHVLAPVLAITSGLTVALPANAATLDPTGMASASATSEAAAAVTGAQDYTVAGGWTIPVATSGAGSTGATVITTPTLVVNFGVSVGQAKAAVINDLTSGGDRAKIISTALEYLGDPYVEGGASHSGIDCSGLVMVAYQSVGINLVHYVPSQDAVATTIPESEAQPGDLVVYDDEAHIGLYLGDGLVLQAPHPGEPVDIIPMFTAPHHFARVLPAGS